MPPHDGAVDWDQASALFSEALELPEHARASWLEQQGGINPATLAELKSLLEAEERHRVLSAEASVQDGGEPSDPPIERTLRLGPYETVRVLGYGGMGTVFLARRVDGEFDQTVALKLIAAPFIREEFVQKFRTERQLLAGLTHPNITRLLDGGVSPQGEPYLVMEYIDGEPLDDYCDADRLGIAARLRLFLQLCEAVEFAHRNLILHRDLKPSNVLVTPGGTVKLLDFGTAALIAQGDAQAAVTRARMLTPRYASPAQLRGERSSVSDDVFSLGVIFYELLTGAWPFGEPNSMAAELKRATEDCSPAPPIAAITADAAYSRGLAVPALSRMLSGDLSAIALKALEHDANRRYATVAQFAGDISRYLEGRPVQARPQTWAYRASKFVRRRWLPVTAAALLVSAISTSAIVAARAARAARAESQKAAEVNRFLNGMLSSASQTYFDPTRYTVAEMLDSSSAQLAKHPPSDARTAAILHLSLARSYIPLTRWDQVELHLNRAMPVFRAVNDRADLADALGIQAGVETLQGQYTAATRHYREALDIYKELGNKALSDTAFDVKSSYAEFLTLILNRPALEVKPLYDDLFAAGARDPSIPRTMVAHAMGNWGLALYLQDKFKEAERILLNALAVGRKEDPGGMWEFFPLMRLAWVYIKEEDWTRGVETGRKLVEIALKNVGPDSPDTANARLIWARSAVMVGAQEQAVNAVRAAMPVLEKAFPPPSLNLWSAARSAALVMLQAGYCPEAERYARESLSAEEPLHLAATDERPARSWQTLGDSLSCQHKRAEALDALNRAAQIYQGAGPSWSRELGDVHASIARLTAHR